MFEYEFDIDGLMEYISSIMNAPKPKGMSFCQHEEIKLGWAQFAVEMNIDKLYESAE